MKVCSTEQEFINIVAEPAQNACRKIGGFLPSALIGQSFLELGAACPDNFDNDGIYDLLEANNMVGIKAELLNDSWSDKTIWDGSYIEKETPEYENGKLIHIVDKFRKYKSIEDSFYDYLLFLKYGGYEKGKPKYGDAVLSITIPEELIRRVNELGYATDPNYWKEVMDIIDRYDLYRFDLEEVPDYVLRIKRLEDRKIINRIRENLPQVPAKRTKEIEFIVIHFLGVGNADNPYLYSNEKGTRGFGGAFYVSIDGTCYQAVDPLEAVTWQCGGGLQGSGGHEFFGECTNYNSIGIENGVKTMSGKKYPDDNADDWYFTEETQESLVWLTSKLMDDYNIPIEHVIRHYSVTGKICPNPFVRNNKLGTSWTWDEFIANLKQYRKDGTITVPVREDDTYMFECKTIKKGSTGNDVYLARCILSGRKWKTADGKLVTTGTDFDAALETVVKRFQKKMGLDSDGIIGPNTWKELLKR